MNDKDINLIEEYIEGKLTGEILSIFEDRLKTDKVLAKEYKQRLKLAKLWIDAEEYQNTKSEIGKLIQKEKSRRFFNNRFYMLSIAASIIILISMYFLLFHENNTNNNGQLNQFADVDDSVSNKENTIIFQYDEPDKLATIDSVPGNIQLLFPIGGETIYKSEPIIFKWKSDSKLIDTLYVCNKLDKKILLKSKIMLSDTTYTIKYPQLTEGKYLWYISASSNFEEFIVIEK